MVFVEFSFVTNFGNYDTCVVLRIRLVFNHYPNANMDPRIEWDTNTRINRKLLNVNYGFNFWRPFFQLKMSRNGSYDFGSKWSENLKKIFLKVVPCFSVNGTFHAKRNPHKTKSMCLKLTAQNCPLILNTKPFLTDF